MVLTLLQTAPEAHGSPTKGTVLAFPVIQPGTASVFSRVDLEGGTWTDVSVESKGGDVRCNVYTSVGSLIASDDDNDNMCSFRIRPSKPGTITLIVTNIHPKEESKTIVVIQ